MSDDNRAEHFVYIYRDTKHHPHYVGYGKHSDRATSHLSGSHNTALRRLIRKGQHTLEIAGPFENESVARAVETAMISALNPCCNVDPGQERWRFRPLGVPEKFAERLTMPPLTRRSFLRGVPGSILFVCISNQNFDDGRKGYDAARPPTDVQVLARMDRWWQLSRYAAVWTHRPGQSPVVLAGVHGRPGAQFVIGAVKIDSSRWSSARRDHGMLQVPTAGPEDLDAFGLRGRRIASDARIRFGAFRQELFIVLRRDARTDVSKTGSRR